MNKNRKANKYLKIIAENKGQWKKKRWCFQVQEQIKEAELSPQARDIECLKNTMYRECTLQQT